MTVTAHRDYRQKVRPSLGTWAFATLMSLSVGVAFGAATSEFVGVALFLATHAAISVGLVQATITITVTDSSLQINRVRIPLWALGPSSALTPEQYRAVLGREANVDALHIVRPWLRSGVRVTISDVHDPHPYVVIGTRKPTALVAALEAASQSR